MTFSGELGMVAIAVPTPPATIAVPRLAATAIDRRDEKNRSASDLNGALPRSTETLRRRELNLFDPEQLSRPCASDDIRSQDTRDRQTNAFPLTVPPRRTRSDDRSGVWIRPNTSACGSRSRGGPGRRFAHETFAVETWQVVARQQ